MSVTVRDRDFSKGAIWRLTLSQALPLMLAQLVQLLYNVVDRIYIGHMDGGDSIALTGVGLTFPVITFIVAFAALFGMGGVPLFSMANGSGDKSRAEKIMGCSCFMLLAGAAVLTVSGYLFCRPILYLLGASDSSYPYAADYLRIYMAGTVFSMLTTGLNSNISAQGFPKTGMFTTIIGAVLNMLLDPLFIFVFGMGIKGAALATVISLDNAFSCLKSAHWSETAEYPFRQQTCRKHLQAGDFKFCDAGYCLLCSGGLQLNFADIRR